MDGIPRSVRRSISEREAVPLCVAASLVYFRLHRKLSVEDDTALDRALNDAALALAQISKIYYENAGRILRIPDDDLRSGLFSHGAKTFKSTAGSEFKELSMRRIDMMRAMEVLEKNIQAVAVARRHEDPASGISRSQSLV